MEKQIMIKHTNNDVEKRVDDIVQYFDVIVCPDFVSFCTFNLYSDQYALLDTIKMFPNSKVKKVNAKSGNLYNEHYVIEICFSAAELRSLFRMVLSHDLNAVICYNGTKFFLNDNDGSFIIIDSKDPKYKLLNSLL